MLLFQVLGNDHSLMDLTLRCINNDPRHRVHASEIMEQLAVILQFPGTFTNRMEMLRYIESKEQENRALREADNCQKEQEIIKEAQGKVEEVDQLNLIYSSEVEHLKLQVRDLNAQNQLLVTK